jgi:hypothetical protein
MKNIETLLLPLDQILASLSKKTTKFMLDIKESPSKGMLSHLIGYTQIILKRLVVTIGHWDTYCDSY